MASTISHVTAALELIGASSPIKPASPEIIARVKDALNQMIASWVNKGIEVGVIQNSTPGNEANEDDWAALAIRYNLAVLAGPICRVDVPPVVAMKAVELYEEMRSATRLTRVAPVSLQRSGRFPRGAGNGRG